MVAGVAAAMAISIIATCAGSLYYCNKPMEYLRKVTAKIQDDISGKCVDCVQEEFRVSIEKENRTERKRTNSSSSIANDRRDDASKKFISERANRGTITSTEYERRTIVPSKGGKVVPVRPPRRRREVSRTFEDFSGQFSSIESRRSSTNNGSSCVSCVIDDNNGIKRVKAQIETRPREIISSDKTISNSLKSESSIRAVDPSTEESTLKASGERSVVTSLGTKNDHSEKVKTRKTINAIAQSENDETEGSSSQYPFSKDRSMMFQVNRRVNASTSTKISSHARELKEFDSEQVASVQEIWNASSCNTEEYSVTILKEVLSFLSHEEKDCAFELSTSRARNDEEGESNDSRDDNSRIVTIQIRKYHLTNGNFQNKSTSSVSRLIRMYGKLTGRIETNDKEKSSLSSREASKTRHSSINSTDFLSTSDKTSYYPVRVSEVDEAIFQKKKNREKENSSRLDKSKNLSKLFQCQKCV